MTTTQKQINSEIFKTAWQFVKRNGFNMQEALVTAWQNYKLRCAMTTRIVKFYFTKVDGSLREAYGTLKANLLPETKGCDRRANDTIQTYFDTERGDWRCFKKANLLKIA